AVCRRGQQHPAWTWGLFPCQDLKAPQGPCPPALRPLCLCSPPQPLVSPQRGQAQHRSPKSRPPGLRTFLLVSIGVPPTYACVCHGLSEASGWSSGFPGLPGSPGPGTEALLRAGLRGMGWGVGLRCCGEGVVRASVCTSGAQPWAILEAEGMAMQPWGSTQAGSVGAQPGTVTGGSQLGVPCSLLHCISHPPPPFPPKPPFSAPPRSLSLTQLCLCCLSDPSPSTSVLPPPPPPWRRL
ncbi:Hypothetical predicted protein, partial [Marmota monax]